MTSENVTHLPGQEPDHPGDQAALYWELYARIGRILEPGFPSVADYLRTGEAEREYPYSEIIDSAAALAEVLSAVDTRSDEISDACVSKACGLLYHLLSIGQNVCQAEAEYERNLHFARVERERAEREAEAHTPRGIVDSIAFLSGMTEQSQGIIPRAIAELAAEIVQARMEADKDTALYIDPADPQELGVEGQATAAQAHRRHLAVLTGPEDTRTWLVDDNTAEALRPLAADESGREATEAR